MLIVLSMSMCAAFRNELSYNNTTHISYAWYKAILEHIIGTTWLHGWLGVGRISLVKKHKPVHPNRRDLVSQPLLWHCAELKYVGTGYIVSVGKTKWSPHCQYGPDPLAWLVHWTNGSSSHFSKTINDQITWPINTPVESLARKSSPYNRPRLTPVSQATCQFCFENKIPRSSLGLRFWAFVFVRWFGSSVYGGAWRSLFSCWLFFHHTC